VSNTKSNGRDTSSANKNQTFGNYGKKHYDYCLKGTDNCFGKGKDGNKVRYFPNVRGQYKGSGQYQVSGSSNSSKKNLLYALRSRVKQSTFPDVVNSMLKVFSIDVYAILDPEVTLLFFTPLVTKKFYLLHDILHEALYCLPR